MIIIIIIGYPPFSVLLIRLYLNSLALAFYFPLFLKIPLVVAWWGGVG